VCAKLHRQRVRLQRLRRELRHLRCGSDLPRRPVCVVESRTGPGADTRSGPGAHTRTSPGAHTRTRVSTGTGAASGSGSRPEPGSGSDHHPTAHAFSRRGLPDPFSGFIGQPHPLGDLDRLDLVGPTSLRVTLCLTFHFPPNYKKTCHNPFSWCVWETSAGLRWPRGSWRISSKSAD